jgi:Cu2+-containing amine oxidase
MCALTGHHGSDGLTVSFHSGEYGMGTQANELSLGCDCLGQIHYLVCTDAALVPFIRSNN